MSVVEDVRKVLQDFLAPELRAVHVRLDARFDTVSSRFSAIDEKIDARFEMVSTRIVALDGKIDGLKTMLELEKRVERLESRQPQEPS